MGSNKIKSHLDISPKMREIIEWRTARKLQLRERYLREILHPTKQELVIDDALHRFNFMRHTHQYHINTSGKAIAIGLFSIVAITYITMGSIVKIKGNEEHLLRTGQISYADREFKFQ